MIPHEISGAGAPALRHAWLRATQGNPISNACDTRTHPVEHGGTIFI